MLVWERIAGALAKHERCLMVTVVAAQGSVPREAGARMVVVPGGGFFGTIGGGTLEWQALAAAQGDLAAPDASFRLRDFALGPELGQCCGGRVTLAFEPFDRVMRAVVEDLARREAGGLFRATAEIAGGRVRRRVDAGSETLAGLPGAALDPQGRLVEVFGDTRRRLLLFGAGHVGRALILALAPLPFRVDWIDPRSGAFPPALPENLRAISSADPKAELAAAPDGAFVLVMTHSHPLDFEIVDAALGAGRFPYVGLIGSATKRARFEKRLAEGGLAKARIAELVCPIGLTDIASKEPAAIAVGVAAELLIRDERLRGARRAGEEGRAAMSGDATRGAVK